MTGAAGGIAVALVIVVLVVRDATRASGRVLTPATVPLLLVAGAVLAARAVAVFR